MSVAETMVKAQLINWLQAVKIKIRPNAFALPPTTPKKSRNMSMFFLVGIFFLTLGRRIGRTLHLYCLRSDRSGAIGRDGERQRTEQRTIQVNTRARGERSLSREVIMGSS